jgi:hypothetical protein
MTTTYPMITGMAITLGDLALLLVLSLAGCRITRIVMLDTISEPIRRWVWNRYGVDSKPGLLLGCPWCVSWWVSITLVGYSWLAGMTSSFWVALLLIPAVAYLTPAVGRLIERDAE